MKSSPEMRDFFIEYAKSTSAGFLSACDDTFRNVSLLINLLLIIHYYIFIIVHIFIIVIILIYITVMKHIFQYFILDTER